MSFPDIAVVLIDVENSRPPIWRRVLVSAFAKLGGLHHVIQAAMGWDDSFPHQFVLRGDVFKRVVAGEALDAKRERNWRLDSAGYPDHFFYYEYGANGKWRLRIVLEDYADQVEHSRYPRCVGGSGNLPGAKPFSVGSANRSIWKAVPRRW